MLKRMGAFKNIEREEMHKLESECEATKEIDEKVVMLLGGRSYANP